jgi:hypothetical protein
MIILMLGTLHAERSEPEGRMQSKRHNQEILSLFEMRASTTDLALLGLPLSARKNLVKYFSQPLRKLSLNKSLCGG